MVTLTIELHCQVIAIQMGTHNICLNKIVDKKYTCYNLKPTELLDCGLIGVCAVIRLNMVISFVCKLNEVGYEKIYCLACAKHRLK